MGRSEDDLERLKTHLRALAGALPDVIEQVRARANAVSHTLTPASPDPDLERQRLDAFGTYLDHYSHSDGPMIDALDLRAVLERSVALASGEIHPKARIHTSYLEAPFVWGHARQLGQVFISLLINAAQALPAGAPDENHVSIELDTAEAGWARVRIFDTGSGISEELLPHIFEPLFSTKRGAGMGIGLAIVHEVVQQFGGRVSVESKVGTGTMFTIELPPV